MELMERIKAECKKHKGCTSCNLYNHKYHDCKMNLFTRDSPMFWDIEAIRKELGAEIDGAVVGEEKSCTRVDGAVEAVVEEITVPEKWEAVYEALGEDQEEKIVVPKKHEDNYINALKGTIYNNVLIKQNEIIECLEQISKEIETMKIDIDTNDEEIFKAITMINDLIKDRMK